MSAIIAALLAALGPILAEFLLKWIESLFNKSAKGMDTDQFDTDGEAAEALVQKSHDATPRFRFFKRILLRRIKDHAAGIVAGNKLSKADKAELKAIGAAAARE